MKRVKRDADGTLHDRPVPHSGPLIPGKSRRLPFNALAAQILSPEPPLEEDGGGEET